MLFRLRCHLWKWETGWGRGQTPVVPQMSQAHFRGHAVQRYLLATVCQEVLDPVRCLAFYAIVYPACRGGGCGPLYQMPSRNPPLQHRLACLGLCWCAAPVQTGWVGFRRTILFWIHVGSDPGCGVCQGVCWQRCLSIGGVLKTDWNWSFSSSALCLGSVRSSPGMLSHSVPMSMVSFLQCFI